MSKDYVANNEGQGFASFDDDGPDDLDSLLAGAAQGEEKTDEDTSVFFGGRVSDDDEEDDYSTPTRASQPSPAYESPKVDPEPVYEAPSYSTESSYSVQDAYSTPEPAYIPEPVYTPEPVAAPEPTYTTPEVQSWDDPSYGTAYSSPAPVAVPSPSVAPVSSYVAPAPTPVAPTRIQMRTEADQLNLVRKAIKILEAYRPLKEDVKAVVSQLISNGEDLIDDEAKFVVKVLNVDSELDATMQAFVEAKGLEPVERAFYVIGLDDKTMYSLGSLVSAFSGESIDTSLTKILYSKAMVHDIEKLDRLVLEYVEATSTILAASREESN